MGAQLGEQYLKPPPFDLKGCHEDSAPGQPLVFVLSPGSDPMAALMSFADSIKANVQQISLGQGQGKFAEEMIAEGRKTGSWVVLQNCHLATSWMASLERICEQLENAAAGKPGGDGEDGDEEPLHRNFRLWLTSYPTKDFPVSVLQNGIKMTNEPPKGLRNNLERSYLSDPIVDPKFFTGVSNRERFRRMLFGLCFFHAMVQERRQFGPLGWNIPYEFNESDLRISVRQLAIFADDKNYSADPADESVSIEDALPYDTLRYLTGECNYGGRVTDDKDRRCLLSILRMFYCGDIHEPDKSLSPSGNWKTPPDDVREHADYLKFIQGLPVVSAPEVFGLHSNATITKDLNETNSLFTSILLTERGGGGGGSKGSGKSKEDTIGDVASDVLSKIRDIYDLEAIGGKYPTDPKQSMNTVLVQELARFNVLIKVVKDSLRDVVKALQGLVVMSTALEQVADDLFFGRVPSMWLDRSYPSLKPLGSYVGDLVQRLEFFDNWVEHGVPVHYWMPGFFFTQGFLTGALQNYARKYTVPIDQVTFEVECTRLRESDIKEAPEDGIYVWGLYFDGCRWDSTAMRLAESEPKQLFAPAPVMWLKPTKVDEMRKFNSYNAPVYKTTERRGMLSTTGHSTNFVMMMKLACAESPDHWIRRGVALLLALDD